VVSFKSILINLSKYFIILIFLFLRNYFVISNKMMVSVIINRNKYFIVLVFLFFKNYLQFLKRMRRLAIKKRKKIDSLEM